MSMETPTTGALESHRVAMNPRGPAASATTPTTVYPEKMVENKVNARATAPMLFPPKKWSFLAELGNTTRVGRSGQQPSSS